MWMDNISKMKLQGLKLCRQQHAVQLVLPVHPFDHLSLWFHGQYHKNVQGFVRNRHYFKA